MSCRSIGILLEGDGDYDSVPLLFRKISEWKNYFDLKISTKPIMVGDLVGALTSSRFIRMFEYVISRADVDGVIIALDCEDHCTVEAVQSIYERIRDLAQRLNKPVAVVLFVREYETMFLVNIEHICCRCTSIQIDSAVVSQEHNLLSLRNAKGLLKRAIRNNSYKETRDQPRLTGAMDVATCIPNYQPLGHFARVIDWIYSWDGTTHLY